MAESPVVIALGRRVAELEERQDEAELLLREVRRVFLGAEMDFPAWMRLTKTETRFLQVLMMKDVATKEQILFGLYNDRHIDDQPDAKSVDVYAFKVRKKLSPLGVSIETIWGRGYRLTDSAKARFHELLSMTEPPAEGQRGAHG
ncbi:MAG: helix-turn-helix domain-containing protein [Magnetovibrionaceae bacterium]